MMRSRTGRNTRWAALLASLLGAATLTIGADATAQGVPVEQATPMQKNKARLHFARGKQLFDAKKYEEALTELRASYDMVASPNSRILIAQTLDLMGRSAEAYGEATAVMAEAEKAAATDPKYAKTAEAAKNLRDAIRPNVGMLTVQVPPEAPGPVTINGHEFPREYWNQPVPVMPGPLTVQMGAEPAQQVDLVAGGDATVNLAPPPPAAPPPPPPPPPQMTYAEQDDDGGLGAKGVIGIVAISVGGAALINASIFGAMTSGYYTDAELLCPTKTNCSPIVQDTIDSGKTTQLVANVSFVIGLVGIVGGTGLLVWDLVEPDEPGEGQVLRDDSEFSVVKPQLVVGPGSLGVQGSF